MMLEAESEDVPGHFETRSNRSSMQVADVNRSRTRTFSVPIRIHIQRYPTVEDSRARRTQEDTEMGSRLGRARDDGLRQVDASVT